MSSYKKQIFSPIYLLKLAGNDAVLLAGGNDKAFLLAEMT